MMMKDEKKDPQTKKKKKKDNAVVTSANKLQVFGLLPLKNKLLINEFLLLIFKVFESIKSYRKSVILKLIW